jgi:hypothetical protein
MSDIQDLRNRLNPNNPTPVNATEAPLAVHRAAMFELTAGELRSACDENTSHPLADTFRKAVNGMPGPKLVTVERIDIQALLEDKLVETKTVLETSPEGTNKVSRKTLVARPTSTKPVAKPTPAKPESV